MKQKLNTLVDSFFNKIVEEETVIDLYRDSLNMIGDLTEQVDYCTKMNKRLEQENKNLKKELSTSNLLLNLEKKKHKATINEYRFAVFILTIVTILSNLFN